MPPKGIVLPLNDRPTSRILTHRPDSPPTAACEFLCRIPRCQPIFKEAFRSSMPTAESCASKCCAPQLPELLWPAETVLLPHAHGFGTTRREPNRTPTARNRGLPPVCPNPQEYA